MLKGTPVFHYSSSRVLSWCAVGARGEVTVGAVDTIAGVSVCLANGTVTVAATAADARVVAAVVWSTVLNASFTLQLQ